MRRILGVLVVCASCGGAETQAPLSEALADGAFTKPESCHVVKDDLGAVGFFASFEPGLSPIPERLDSIVFLDRDKRPVLRWDGGVDLEPFEEPASRRARRGPTTPEKPRLRYATNVRPVDWGADPSRWPLTVTVKVAGETYDPCGLGELAGFDPAAPTVLRAAGDESVNYGNCPHCAASFLCGCLGLQDELDYCDSLPPPETLQNCADVTEWLFRPAAL